MGINMIESKKRIVMNTPHTATATGQMAGFTTDMIAPLKGLHVGLTYVQAGSGDPSPDNVRAITGYSSTKIYTAGKNLAPTITPGTYSNGLTITLNNDGTYTVNGHYNRTSNGAIGNQSSHYELPPQEYAVSGGYSSYYRVQVADLSSNNSNVYSAARSPETIATLAKPFSGYVRLHITYSSSMPDANNIVIYPMVRRNGQGTSDFEPYAGTIQSVSWSSSAGTIYGGQLDPINGTLTVTHVKATCDGSVAFDYGALTYTSRFAKSITLLGFPAPKAVEQLVPFNYLTSTTSISTEWAGHVRQNGIVYVYTPKSIASKAAFTTYLSEHPLEFVYELAIPIVYSITPVSVKTLRGINNIWCGAEGSTTTVNYWKH